MPNPKALPRERENWHPDEKRTKFAGDPQEFKKADIPSKLDSSLGPEGRDSHFPVVL